MWDYGKPLQGSLSNNQDSMESEARFFSWLTWWSHLFLLGTNAPCLAARRIATHQRVRKLEHPRDHFSGQKPFAKESARRARGLQFKIIPWNLNIEIQLVSASVHLLMCEFPSGKGEFPPSYIGLPRGYNLLRCGGLTYFLLFTPVCEDPFGASLLQIGGSTTSLLLLLPDGYPLHSFICHQFPSSGEQWHCRWVRLESFKERNFRNL